MHIRRVNAASAAWRIIGDNGPMKHPFMSHAGHAESRLSRHLAYVSPELSGCATCLCFHKSSRAHCHPCVDRFGRTGSNFSRLRYQPIPSRFAQMHLILTGATGLCGSSVLDAMLKMKEVTKISIISRRPVKMAEDSKDPRIDVILHQDFEKYDASLLSQLQGATGCVWSLGISQTQVNAE